MMGLHSPSWSSGKLPLWGGIGLAVFCPPPGPPKLITLSQVLSALRMFNLSRYRVHCILRERLLLVGSFDKSIWTQSTLSYFRLEFSLTR